MAFFLEFFIVLSNTFSIILAVYCFIFLFPPPSGHKRTPLNIHDTASFGLCATGNPEDFTKESFSTCVRYLIQCWFWASRHLPPVKTHRAPQQHSGSQPKSRTEHSRLPWLFSHIFVCAEISCNFADAEKKQDSSRVGLSHCTLWSVHIGFCTLFMASTRVEIKQQFIRLLVHHSF